MIPWLWNPLSSQVVALAASTSDNPFIVLANFGTLGIWVACTMTGLQPTRAEVRRLDAEIARLIAQAATRDEKDRAKDQAVEALVNLMSSRTLPTLATAVAEMPQQAPSLGRLEELLSRIEQGLSDDKRPS